MKKISILILIIAFSSIKLFSQITTEEKEVNIETYNLYEKGNWKSLIKTGEKAISQGIDFYYLNYRVGIAYYNLKKYGLAAKYFEKVYKQTPIDDTVTEYLYYSYVYSGMYDDARALTYKMSDKLKAKLKITGNKLAESIGAQYIYENIENYEDTTSSGSYQTQDIVTKQNVFNVNLKHNIKKRISIFHGYTQVNLTTKHTSNSFPSYFVDTKQTEYFLMMKLHIATRADFIIGFHYLNTALSIPKPLEEGIPMFLPGNKSFAVSIGFHKRLPMGGYTISSSFSNLNSYFQIQPQFSFYLYPFGNNNFFTNTTANFQIQKTIMSIGNGNRLSQFSNYYYKAKQSVGFFFAKYFTFSVFGEYGNMPNYTENFATLVNNDADITKIKTGALLSVRIKHFNIFAEYNYKIKSNIYEISGNTNSLDYTNQTIYVGANWYF